jgi:hypothetical protein
MYIRVSPLSVRSMQPPAVNGVTVRSIIQNKCHLIGWMGLFDGDAPWALRQAWGGMTLIVTLPDRQLAVN